MVTRWKTRDDARNELVGRPRVYTRMQLLAMIAKLQRELGYRTVEGIGVPFHQWSRDELITETLDLLFACRVCRGKWAHRTDCPHYEPCPAGHLAVECCPRCKRPAAEPAGAGV